MLLGIKKTDFLIFKNISIYINIYRYVNNEDIYGMLSPQLALSPTQL